MAPLRLVVALPDDSAKGDKADRHVRDSTLSEDETIANLATGAKRFKLPDEFNPFRIWQTIIASGKSNEGQQARELIAHFYENRRQYPKAVEAGKRRSPSTVPATRTDSVRIGKSRSIRSSRTGAASSRRRHSLPAKARPSIFDSATEARSRSRLTS